MFKSKRMMSKKEMEIPAKETNQSTKKKTIPIQRTRFLPISASA